MVQCSYNKNFCENTVQNGYPHSLPPKLSSSTCIQWPLLRRCFLNRCWAISFFFATLKLHIFIQPCTYLDCKIFQMCQLHHRLHWLAFNLRHTSMENGFPRYKGNIEPKFPVIYASIFVVSIANRFEEIFKSLKKILVKISD